MAQRKRYWFKAKDYGYGWYPATWQGWLALGLFLLFVIINVLRLVNSQEPEQDVLLWFLPQTLALTFIFYAICLYKGEKPSWWWGKKHHRS